LPRIAAIERFPTMQIQAIPDEHQPPRVSVIVPVFNGGAQLESCLAAIAASSCPPDECIVVDDASTDGMPVLAAERHGARLIRLDRRRGPAFARNLGAGEACGDILFFCDADVLLDKDALATAVGTLEADPRISAVFGSYDDEPGDPSFLSQYRNLYHHWVHQSADPEASTFWAGCGAIRRDAFREMQGFDCDYSYPSIEDIELGGRLHRAGHRIRLEKGMRGKHLKRWTLWNMVRTDVMKRGVPWFQLVLRDRQAPRQLNLDYRSRVATLLAALLACSVLVLPAVGRAAALLPTVAFVCAAGAGVLLARAGGRSLGRSLLALVLVVLAPLAAWLSTPDWWAIVPLSLCLGVVVSQAGFYRHVAQRRGVAFAIAVIPAQLLFFAGCALSVVLGLAAYLTQGRWIRKAGRGPPAR
jgi:hypothetical protein